MSERKSSPGRCARLTWWGFTEKKETSHFLGLRGRHQYSDQRSNRNRAPCVASTAVWTEGEKGQMARSSVSIKRVPDGRRQRGRKIIGEEREKYRAKNGSLRNTSTDSKATTVILIDHRSAPIRKERLSPMSKTRREASRNQFVAKGGMLERVKSFREINSREDRPRARPGFVKPIRNGLRKKQNSIQCRPFRAEPAWRRERMELDSRKEE